MASGATFVRFLHLEDCFHFLRKLFEKAIDSYVITLHIDIAQYEVTTNALLQDRKT